MVVLACWNYRCPGSDDNSGQLASPCGQERLRSALAGSLWCLAIHRRLGDTNTEAPAFIGEARLLQDTSLKGVILKELFFLLLCVATPRHTSQAQQAQSEERQ